MLVELLAAFNRHDVDAIKRAGNTDSAAVKTAIEGTKDFKGITGAITFSADSHVPQKGVTVIAVKGGKFTRVFPSKAASFDCNKKNVVLVKQTGS